MCIHQKLLNLIYISLLSFTVTAQRPCKNFDLLNVPGKWHWKQAGTNIPIPSQLWTYCDPINNEFQRIMPKAPDGIVALSSMSDGGPRTFYNLPKGVRYYQNYFAILDYECAMKPNPVAQRESATGCWIYFDVNNHNNYGKDLRGNSEVMFDEFRYLHLLDMWTETDANGNRLLYTRSNEEGVVREAFVFSVKKRLPYRKVTRKELYTSYKRFHESKLNKEIGRYEKVVKEDQDAYGSLSATEKQKQAYRLDVIKKNKEYLASYISQKEKMINWFATAMKQNNLSDTAYAQEIAAWQFEPEKLDAPPGKGYPVWVEDIDFYDRSLPASQPQFILLYYRRQDEDLPKRNFMNKFVNEFNLDVLYKMVGDKIKKPGGVNTIASSFQDAKTNTKEQQEKSGPTNTSFENDAENQFPSGWEGMNNIKVQKYQGEKWLTMTKDGYWYPRQFNKEIKDGFNLSFDVAWNKDISYYSGLFTVTLGEVPYDNAGERYQPDKSQRMFKSLYDSYAGAFNRVTLWFDPHWNGGGQLTVYAYNWSETVNFKTQILLPEFFKETNNHQLKIHRQGNSLVVTLNNKKIADLPKVFSSEVKYNFYGFSRYKGNDSDNPNDAFYLKDLKANY